MTPKEKRQYYLVAIVLCLLCTVVIDLIAVTNTNVGMSIAGIALSLTTFVLVLAWIVNYLHELDARLTEQEKKQ